MYNPKLDIKTTEAANRKIKEYFESHLSKYLNLLRVEGPLFLPKNCGLNDNLSGVEKPVNFEVDKTEIEVVHSLAKWKRNALYDYNFDIHHGLYVNMSAIRKDEHLDAIHSLFVDQWDWELPITKEERNLEFLRIIVEKIYSCLKKTELYIKSIYPNLTNSLPDRITFITAQELEDLYPLLDTKQREYEIVKKYGAVFIMQIGDKLLSGKPHDGRAPDYDDWKLNGDILVYDKVTDSQLELSSMGIRVDSKTLLEQLKKANNMDRLPLPYHQNVINDIYPYTIGGGIGQSRLCMFLLDKLHIGEVQSSFWPKKEKERCKKLGIHLL